MSLEAVAALCEKLANDVNGLQNLEMCKCAISDQGGIFIGKMLRINTHLEYLDLRHNLLEDISAIYLIDVLKLESRI